jgi:hypothetical protein
MRDESAAGPDDEIAATPDPNPLSKVTHGISCMLHHATG